MKKTNAGKYALGFMIIGALCLAAVAAAGWAAAKGSAGAGYFPCKVTPLMNRDFFPALTKAVDGAQDEILVAVFSFKAGVHKKSRPDILVEHLARAVKRGVDVKVILENCANPAGGVTRQNAKTKNILEKRGVKVYMDEPSRTTHTKLVVVDQKLVFVGSHNFTPSALNHNNEVTVMIEKSGLAKEVRAYILNLIREAK
jgi:phosphatidylserine/phosphatidylglycerophosphate/cardiolipin synthase-like enzyme